MALMVDTIGGHPCNTKITRIALIRYMANFGFDSCDALSLRSLKPFVLYLPVLCRLPCRCFHHNNHVTRLSVKLTSCLSAIVTRHRRKLLLGPGAQAPHFYDHGARLYDEPPHFCDVILSKLCFNCLRWFYAM